jgi:hypothetical protein
VFPFVIFPTIAPLVLGVARTFNDVAVTLADSAASASIECKSNEELKRTEETAVYMTCFLLIFSSLQITNFNIRLLVYKAYIGK